MYMYMYMLYIHVHVHVHVFVWRNILQVFLTPVVSSSLSLPLSPSLSLRPSLPPFLMTSLPILT